MSTTLIRTVYTDTAHALKGTERQNGVEYARTYCGLWIPADYVLGASCGEKVCKTCTRAAK